jgi:hypothetical protein
MWDDNFGFPVVLFSWGGGGVEEFNKSFVVLHTPTHASALSRGMHALTHTHTCTRRLILYSSMLIKMFQVSVLQHASSLWEAVTTSLWDK